MQVMLYTKTIKVKKEDGSTTTFPKYLSKIDNKITLETNLSNDCKADLIKQMAKGDFDFPIMIEPLSYFTKSEKYTNKKGEERSKEVLVLTEVKVLSQAQFENKTLEDIVAEIESKNVTPINDEEVPF